MRVRDETKKIALYKATIKIVNKDGFAAAAVNKIAKVAKVSPGTVYIYFDNKDDLLLSTFVEIKKELNHFLMANIDSNKSVIENARVFWHRLFAFVSNNADKYQYIDQFSHSPLIHKINDQKLTEPYAPFYAILENGIAQGIIKNIPKPMLLAFLLAPVVFLAKSRLSVGFDSSAEQVESAFILAWEAISAKQ